MSILGAATHFGWIIAWFVTGICMWYVVFGVEYAQRDSCDKTKRFWVLRCFAEEASWYLPGGLARREALIRALVDAPQDLRVTNYMCGHSYGEIRWNPRLQARLAKEAFWSPLEFWSFAFGCLLLGPVMISLCLVSYLSVLWYTSFTSDVHDGQ